MSSSGKHMKFPNKDRLQLGSASPDENYPSQTALASSPGTCREGLCVPVLREHCPRWVASMPPGSPGWPVPCASTQWEILTIPQNPEDMDSQGQKPKHIPWFMRIQTKREVVEENSWHSQHSQLAKAEWKNHYWMFFLCHSEEPFWCLHRPSLSTEKQKAYLYAHSDVLKSNSR